MPNEAQQWVKHIQKEGAYYHVLRWDSFGCHCSEPNCEINRDTEAYNREYKRKES